MTLQKTAQSITPTYRRFTQLTQKLCLQRLVITVISSDILLTTLSAPPSLQTKLADLPESMSELWLVSLMLSGWCPGREPRRTIPGRGEGCPTSRGGWGEETKKKKSMLTTAAFPTPLLPLTLRSNHHPPTMVQTVLRIPANTCHPQLFAEFISLPFLPHYTQ